MRTLFLLVILLPIFPSNLICQEKKEEILEIPRQEPVSRMSLDPAGHLYLLSESTVFQYDFSGKLLHSYTCFPYGNIHSISPSNPMKIMLFFKDAGRILFLDDRLGSVIAEFDLLSANFPPISLATYGTDNQIWLYDQSNSTLYIRDSRFLPVGQVTYNLPHFQPIQLIEIPGRKFLMTNPEDALYLFDSFGTLVKTLPIQTEHPVQVIGNTIYYMGKENMEKYDYLALRHEVSSFPCANLRQILIYGDHVATLSQEGKVTLLSFGENW